MQNSREPQTLKQRVLFWLPGILAAVILASVGSWETEPWWTRLGYSALLGITAWVFGILFFVIIASLLAHWYRGDDPSSTVDYLFERQDLLVAALTFGVIIGGAGQYTENERLKRLTRCVDDYAGTIEYTRPIELIEWCLELEAQDNDTDY